jgi:hypothetical protein
VLNVANLRRGRAIATKCSLAAAGLPAALPSRQLTFAGLLTNADRQPNVDAITIDELIATVEARSADPAERLRHAVALAGELADLGDALIGRFVADARAAGASWTDIGQAFGTSKQAAQQRFGAAPSEPGSWPGRWTPAARAALERAGGEAALLGHDYVGTEHALLALVAGDRDVAAEVLAGLGITRERVLATSCMRPGPPVTGDLRRPLMPRFKQALEYSRLIADALGAGDADTGHLLAGIVSVPDAMAVEILRRLGAPAGDVRRALAERLDVEPQRLDLRRRRRRHAGWARV